MLHGLLAELVIAYGVGVLVVLLLHRLRVPTVVGFLIAGVLIGPHGLGFVRDIDGVSALADIGVVILLFTIGVEMSLARIVKMGASLLVAGGLQIALTTTGVAASSVLRGSAFGPAVTLGLLVTVSSTTLLLRTLGERGELDAPQGRIALGISIAQDLAVIPIMILLPLLGGEARSTGESALALGKAVGVIAGTVVLARLVVPRVFEAVVNTRSRELFALTVVFLCLGTAWLASLAGLSLALGAFLGGLVVAESPYSQQVLGEMLPLRDGLSGLFFVGVGMLLNLGLAIAHPIPVVLAVVAILAGKAVIAAISVLAAGYGVRTAILAGIALSQVGEFSFVLAREATKLGLFDDASFQLFLAAAVLTMAVSPFAYRIAPAIADAADRRTRGRFRGRLALDTPGDEKHTSHVIVVGFGLTGRNTARALTENGIDFVAIDMNPETVRRERASGVPILYGDAGHREVLDHAGLAGARVVVIAISDLAGTKRVLSTVKSVRPGLRVIIRARYVREVAEYQALAADEVVPDEVETSVEILARVLRAYDLPSHAIERSVRAARADAFEAVRSTAARHGLSASRARAVAEVDIESHVVGPGSPADGKTLADLMVRARHGVTVVGLRRGGDVVPEPGAQTRLEAADVVILVGAPDRLASAAELFRAVGQTGAIEAPDATLHADPESEPERS
jgi:monovalent cation:H+ antiporter-2, CPA2 family